MAVMRTVQQAKIILIETKGMSETDAYNALRDQAMAKREPVEKIAEALVKAHELRAWFRLVRVLCYWRVKLIS